jgi:hypothetical protein
MMSEHASVPSGPYAFALTQEEAKTAAARAGLRAILTGRLSRNHVAPLVVFTLFLIFVAILTFTGLLARRLGEAALILAAIAFMASRMAAHWRLRGAQKNSLAAALAWQAEGETKAWVDESGLRLENAAGSRRVVFADCDEVEDAGGMIYLWQRSGEPAFLPARAFEGDKSAQEFVKTVRGRLGRGRAKN